jgi:hypothetical protein
MQAIVIDGITFTVLKRSLASTGSLNVTAALHLSARTSAWVERSRTMARRRLVSSQATNTPPGVLLRFGSLIRLSFEAVFSDDLPPRPKQARANLYPGSSGRDRVDF